MWRYDSCQYVAMRTWKEGVSSMMAGIAYLEGILPRKALVTPAAGIWFNSQMDALVSLEVVVSVERLRALITLEGTVIVVGLLLTVHAGSMTAVVAWLVCR